MSNKPVATFHRETHHPFVRDNKIEWISPLDLLGKIEQKSQSLSKFTKPSAVVFDLDSTLFCTGPRLKKIFRHYLLQQPSPHSHWLRVLDHMGSHNQRYSVPETLFLLLSNFISRAEAEAMTRQMWLEFEPYWREEFFKSRHIEGDPPYEGAVDFVHAVHDTGYEVVYLTGRDAFRGMEGTTHALRRWRFPRSLKTHTILKPDPETRDLEFKRQMAHVLHHRFHVDFVIDNEPENLVMFAERVPRAEVVFFHSIMSRRAPSRPIVDVLAGRPLLGLKSFRTQP